MSEQTTGSGSSEFTGDSAEPVENETTASADGARCEPGGACCTADGTRCGEDAKTEAVASAVACC
jgi:hypothetical protein